MHWVKVTRPKYEQSERYRGEIGEVVGRWGPENSASSKEGWLVEFADGEVVGVTEDEVEVAERPARDRPEDGTLGASQQA
ncbi:MAG TPA: hypothetical protein VK966_04170 [Longimicrobiales bacterium]|nr:hypothetical protein [Longimicrobiales bacterium]